MGIDRMNSIIFKEYFGEGEGVGSWTNWEYGVYEDLNKQRYICASIEKKIYAGLLLYWIEKEEEENENKI